jgi:phage terminase large subunit-like protein
MYQYSVAVASGEIDDPTWFSAWWQPKDLNDIDHKDPAVWKHANPGYIELIDPADFESAVQRTPEPEFKTKRLNMWVDQATQWIPQNQWDSLDESEPISHTDRYVLGVDASFSGDSTAIVACSVSETPGLHLLKLWEKPANDEERNWRVNPLDIEAAIDEFCRTHNVIEVCYDPYRMQRSAAVLLEQGVPMVEFPQSPSRMVPATGAFYEAVMTGGLRHDRSLALTRHILNAATKNDPRGTKIVKSAYTKKIDAAVASIMAFSRAQWHSQQPVKVRRAFGF